MLILVLVLTTTSIASADSDELPITISEGGELTDEVLSYITEDEFADLDNIFTELLKEGSLTQDEMDKYAVDYYYKCYNKRISEIKGKEISTKGIGDYLANSYNKLNDAEKALAKKYPSDLAAYYSCSKIATNSTNDRYSSGKYLGNGDAYRHALWNALLICRFYELGKGNADFCTERTKLWTTAHEEIKYADRSYEDMSKQQFEKDKEMDLFNNKIGRVVGRAYYNNQAKAKQKIGERVDSGDMKKIKKNTQMNWSAEKMINEVSTWTLRATTTKGKKS